MDRAQKQKNLRNLQRTNVLESVKDIGASSARSLKSDLLSSSSEEFFNQLFGSKAPEKFSGELTPGESLEIKDVYSGKEEENQKLRQQISLERRLAEEEKKRIEKKGNELKIQLHALMQEVLSLAKVTHNLGQEVESAAIQAPANPGVYHVIFFEKLLEFLKSFRRKIESADIWLTATNKRAEKKNFWGIYKNKKTGGSKFLLSPDHYLQRSAG